MAAHLLRAPVQIPFMTAVNWHKPRCVVAINYRLGAFGYMARPELSAETVSKSSGNYGTSDQIQALRWVHENIAAFGGDADNVTIFGESAGSWSVNHLVSSPAAAGLFHRAIGQSGGQFRRLHHSLRSGHRSAESRGVALQVKLVKVYRGDAATRHRLNFARRRWQFVSRYRRR